MPIRGRGSAVQNKGTPTKLAVDVEYKGQRNRKSTRHSTSHNNVGMSWKNIRPSPRKNVRQNLSFLGYFYRHLATFYWSHYLWYSVYIDTPPVSTIDWSIFWFEDRYLTVYRLRLLTYNIFMLVLCSVWSHKFCFDKKLFPSQRFEPGRRGSSEQLPLKQCFR